MDRSKQELIRLYENGKIREKAFYNPHAFETIAIIEMDDEHVFGYRQYFESKKKYFKLKLAGVERRKFMIDGQICYIDQFLRSDV
jgi:hypothetical protein